MLEGREHKKADKPTRHRTDTAMKRKGSLSEKVATLENFGSAFWGYSNGKHRRPDVQRFNDHLDRELKKLLLAFVTKSYKTSSYKPKEVFSPKHRIVHKSLVRDHVIQWASMLPVERWLMDTLYSRSPACVPGKGTHFFVHQEMSELIHSSQSEVYYYVQLDIHHYFANINHELMKQRIRTKIKDATLLHFWDEFIDSFPSGLVLGVKLSQLLSGLFLAPFDRLALKCFGIAEDIERFHYWQNRYVTDCFITCRTRGQAAELSKGVEYLNAKFQKFIDEGLKHYSRFADNIVIKHSDKVFLHLMVELAVMTLTRDFLLPVNKSWNIRPTWMGNDLCGYVFYHDHLELRKKNKKALCRQVAKMRKKGYSSEQIRLKCASRIGFAGHADSRHLLDKLDINMGKRLGTVIKNRKKKAPFTEMVPEQKKSIEEIICYGNDNDNEKLILLEDYIIDDSVIEKNEDGTPKQRIAIRYKLIDEVTDKGNGEDEYTWSEKEYYSFSGSKVMIDQALNDFSKDDLPVATVIKEFVNKQRKKFYKFT